MGNTMKKHKMEITESDKAVLSLRTQRRRLESHRERVLNQIEREKKTAKELVASGQRGRALLALKKKRIQEDSLKKLDGWLINVESMLAQVETTADQAKLVAALQKGNEALKEMQKMVALEDIEKLLEDTAEAAEYQEELQLMLGDTSVEDQAIITSELEDLQREITQTSIEELPSVPTKQPEVPKAPELVKQEKQRVSNGQEEELMLAA